MFPFGGNPRQMKAMLQRMGIRMEEINASEVIIKGKDGKDLRIVNPEVSKIIMQGNIIFTIAGNVEEIEKETSINQEEKVEINEDDINLVMEQTGCSYETAKKALEESEGDIAGAILKINKK